ncbi:MAG: HEAT repeat domain-containing protein [Candidatus Aminicenantaceae bacterium]
MDKKQRLREVSEIIHLWVKTFGLMKIFTVEHENVRKFTSQLFGKLKDYLEKNFNLEIGIQEFSFTFDGKSVYADEQSGSLPFFFYKDGMAALYFNRGLRKKEFFEFLEIVKHESHLPPEESDIVSAFWERDFVNIRYFAPDEFLEAQIGLDVEVVEYVVDREELYKGRIDLLPEDQKALFNGVSLTESILEAEAGALDTGQDVDQAEGSAESETLLSTAEDEALQEMLNSYRQTSLDGELNSLLLEILYLEEDSAKFGRTLDVLLESHQQYVTEGDFAQADDILVSLNELKDNLASGQEEKRDQLERFWDKLRQNLSLPDIRNAYEQARVHNYAALFSYLGHIGPDALPLVGFLYSETKSPRYQSMARDTLRELGRSAPEHLLDMAQNSRPALTLEIIEIVKELADLRISPRLAGFLNSPNPDIRQSTIRALGQLRDLRSVRLLSACLQDPDESIRILAVQSLKGTEDETIIGRILGMLKEKSFHTLSRAEKQALFEFLAGTRSQRSLNTLGSLIRKVGRFARPRVIETGLLAITALGKAGTPQAAEALEKGCRCSHPGLRKKCRDIHSEVNPT